MRSAKSIISRVVGICCLLGVFCLPIVAKGQFTRMQQDTVQVGLKDTLTLSHAFILPSSIQIQRLDGSRIFADRYRILLEPGLLTVRKPLAQVETWIVSYHYLFQRPADTLAIRNFKRVTDTVTKVPISDVILPTTSANSEFFWPESDGLRKSGSLTRGITVGNNGNLGINSGLNLQLEGDLGDGLTVVGAITDDNLPIQPDGSTQQITDLDQVFLTLAKDGYQLTIGDFEVQRRDSRFANFYRNVQGLQIAFQNPQTQVEVSGAVAKGRFHTNSFPGIDGISGPYRLSGPNGELLFIILAGSEKVYLNGKLMKRGESQDYVINYNTAELTFTPKHVITNVSRIVVDFEFSDRQFNRSLLTAQARHKSADQRLDFSFSYARDADNPNAPFENAEAYFSVVDTLSKVGDQGQAALISGVRLAGFDAERTRYARRDTLVGDSTYVFYELSTDSSEAFYEVLFTQLGPGRGMYERDPSRPTVNAFTWVGPDENGNPMGAYEPVRRWVLPKLLQVGDLKMDYQLSRHLSLYGEGALSDWDQNRLSGFDDEDNQGVAWRLGLRGDSIQLGDSLDLSFDVHHQYIAQQYQNLDRLYQAEYNRYWDLPTIEDRVNEHITLGKLSFRTLRKSQFQAEWGQRSTGAGGLAQRQAYRYRRLASKGLVGEFTFTRIRNQQAAQQRNSQWNRYEGDLGWAWKGLRLGSEIWGEQREVTLAEERSEGTFSFIDLKPYLRSLPNPKWQLDLSYNYRLDRTFAGKSVIPQSKASTWYAGVRLQPHRTFDWQQTVSWRQFDVLDSTFESQGLSDSRTAAVNWQTNWRPRNRLVYLNLVYDVSAEQIAQQEVRFVPVNPGQGTHVWLDSLLNNDGIPDLPEFQLATNPLIADYLRLVVSTQELFPTSRLGLNGLLRWNLQKVVPKGQSRWQDALRLTRATTTFRIIQHKARQNSLGSYLIDITDPFADSSLISASYRLRQDLIFFQNAKAGEVGFYFTDNQTKSFLATGDEFRILRTVGANGRLNLGGQINRSQALEGTYRRGTKSTLAVAFPSRNFDIDFWELSPTFILQLKKNIRLSSGYSFISRINTDSLGMEGDRTALHRLSLDGQVFFKRRNSLTTKLEWTQIRQFGEPSPIVAFELQEGLQPGGNALWQVLASFFVLKNVELTITYDGRASQGLPVLHTGRIEARAFF